MTKLGQVVFNAALGATSYLVDAVAHNEKIDGWKLAASTVGGIASGLIGGNGADGKSLQQTWRYAQKGITRELRRRNTRYAAKQMVKHIASKTAVRKATAVAVGRFALGTYASRRISTCKMPALF